MASSGIPLYTSGSMWVRQMGCCKKIPIVQRCATETQHSSGLGLACIPQGRVAGAPHAQGEFWMGGRGLGAPPG